MWKLPYEIDFNNTEITKKLIEANYSLGELNGLIQILPNSDIILSIMTLRESKDSSAIENVITTYDKLYKEILNNNHGKTSTKEVLNYKEAIYSGAKLLKNNGFLSSNMIIDIHSKLMNQVAGIRKLPRTVIKNDTTNEIVHTPPQKYNEIIDYLNNLEDYINNNEDNDPLINMALIHYQFESIHPFYDGNGRTGRILNILYLMLKNKIYIPILYLSKFINESRDKYYGLLSLCNQDINNINDFVIYMLDGIIETTKLTKNMAVKIIELIETSDILLKEKLPNIYKHEIVLHLFKNLYTKNEVFRNDLKISRNTATKYLKFLEEEGFVISEKVGNEVIYKNAQLFNIVEENH
ncbi:MAG: Fic family protein [Acholeplasma sp.]|nr:Fic family protein [Acholeplasma sp.]